MTTIRIGESTGEYADLSLAVEDVRAIAPGVELLTTEDQLVVGLCWPRTLSDEEADAVVAAIGRHVEIERIR